MEFKLRTEGYAVFTEDEAAIQTQQNPKYGWRPTGGRETSKTTFSISVFGAMSEDRLLKAVDSANSETFQEFLVSSKILHGTGQRILSQVKNDSGVRGISRRRHRLRFPPPVLNPIDTAGGISRDGWPAGISRRAETRPRSSSARCNRLKGYLAA